MARYEFDSIENFASKVKENGEEGSGRFPNVAIKSGVLVSGEKFVGYVLLTAVGISKQGREEPYVYQELSEPKEQAEAQKEADELVVAARDLLQERCPLCEIILGTVTAEWKNQ